MISLSGVAIVGLISSVIGLAVLLGGAVAVLFAYFRKSTRDILRQDNADLRTRLTTVEESHRNCEERLARNEATIKTLTDVVTGASAVAELKDIVDNNHQVVMAKLDQLSSV